MIDAAGRHYETGTIRGIGDLVGWLRLPMLTLDRKRVEVPVWTEFEVKTGKARQTKVQRQHQALVERHGGIYFVIRSVREARAALSRMRGRSVLRVA